MTGAAVRLLAVEGETSGRDLPARAVGHRPGRVRAAVRPARRHPHLRQGPLSRSREAVEVPEPVSPADPAPPSRLGVMGGTFDPIHHGHLVAASEVAAQFALDEVVFVPTGTPWQKQARDVTTAEHRYLMAVIATASNPRFTVSRVDIDRPGVDLHRGHAHRPAGPARPGRRAVLHHRRRRAGPDPHLEGRRGALRTRPLHRRHPARAPPHRRRAARPTGSACSRCRRWRSRPPTAATG